MSTAQRLLDELISTNNLLYDRETRIARARAAINDGDVAAALGELQPLPPVVRDVWEGQRVVDDEGDRLRICELEEELAEIREMGLDQDL